MTRNRNNFVTMACKSCKKSNKQKANFQLIKRFISMKLLRVKDKKGNVRRVTPNAFNLLKGRYTLLEDQDEALETKPELPPSEEDVTRETEEDSKSIYEHPKPFEYVPVDVQSTPTPNQETEIDILANEYTQLTGQKPDGRWSEKKLKDKIEEAKNKKVNEV